jgi:hypothetical protein
MTKKILRWTEILTLFQVLTLLYGSKATILTGTSKLKRKG